MPAITHTTRQFSKFRFRELILYCALKSENHQYFGATKLNKCLFYADFLAYRALGTSITGAEYLALEHGPAPRQLVAEREAMVRDNDIAIQHRPRQQRVIALREPDLGDFSGAEIAIVDQVIDGLRNLDAGDVSDWSHAFLGWKAARAESNATGKHVVISYSTALVSNEPLDEFQESRGLDLAIKYGWDIWREKLDSRAESSKRMSGHDTAEAIEPFRFVLAPHESGRPCATEDCYLPGND